MESERAGGRKCACFCLHPPALRYLLIKSGTFSKKVKRNDILISRIDALLSYEYGTWSRSFFIFLDYSIPQK